MWCRDQKGEQVVQFDSRSPVYIQIVNYFKQKIASGEIEMGAEMPSRRELARKWKINPNTVQRAFKKMEEEKLIYTEGNMPSKVTEEQAMISHVRETLVDEAILEFVSFIYTLKIPLDEVLDKLKQQYDNFDEKGVGEYD